MLDSLSDDRPELSVDSPEEAGPHIESATRTAHEIRQANPSAAVSHPTAGLSGLGNSDFPRVSALFLVPCCRGELEVVLECGKMIDTYGLSLLVRAPGRTETSRNLVSRFRFCFHRRQQ